MHAPLAQDYSFFLSFATNIQSPICSDISGNYRMLIFKTRGVSKNYTVFICIRFQRMGDGGRNPCPGGKDFYNVRQPAMSPRICKPGCQTCKNAVGVLKLRPFNINSTGISVFQLIEGQQYFQLSITMISRYIFVIRIPGNY